MLRDVSYEVYQQYKDRLPENWAKRAKHWYGEYFRVQKGAESWRRGDIETYGQLSCESGKPSIYKYEIGSAELKILYDIMRKADGIYRGRFSGAGVKECCMALFDPIYEKEIVAKVSMDYLKYFPYLEEKYSVNICGSADGVRL